MKKQTLGRLLDRIPEDYYVVVDEYHNLVFKPPYLARTPDLIRSDFEINITSGGPNVRIVECKKKEKGK